MNGHFMLEVLHAAEILPVGVFRPALHRQLVREIEGVLEIVQPGHESHGLSRGAVVFAEMRAESVLERAPVDFLRQYGQGMGDVDYLDEFDLEQAALRVVAGTFLRLHFAGFLSKSGGILQVRIAVFTGIAPVLLRNSGKMRFFQGRLS